MMERDEIELSVADTKRIINRNSGEEFDTGEYHFEIKRRSRRDDSWATDYQVVVYEKKSDRYFVTNYPQGGPGGVRFTQVFPVQITKTVYKAQPEGLDN